MKETKNRWRKFKCAECGWLGRASNKWIERGLPTCHCGGEMIRAVGDETDDDADQ